MLTSLVVSMLLGQANMGLTVPTPGVTPGPTYATQISNDLVIIDNHNHTPGNGVLVPTAGLNVNANLPFNGFGATGFNFCSGTACGILPDGGAYLLLDGGGLVNGAITANSYRYFSNADPLTSAASPISIQNVGDFDSLVPHSILDRAWQNLCSGTGPLKGAIAVGPPAAGNLYQEAVSTNPRGVTEAITMGARVSLPPGATGITLNVNMSDGGANGTVAIGFSNVQPSCGTPSPSSVVTPGATMTTFSQSMSVSPPGLQIAEIIVGTPAWGTTALGAPIVGTVQVKPTGIPSDAGVFAGDFFRIGASGADMWYNDRDEYFYFDGEFRHSPGAELVFDTDSTQIVTEQEWDDTAPPSPNTFHAGVIYVNGRPYANIGASGAGSTYYGQFLSFTLPSGMKRVEVESGGYGDRGVGFATNDNRRGNSLQAVYFPASSTTNLIPPPSPIGRLLEVYGDSIAQGFYAPYTLEQSWTQILRRWFPGQVFFELWSGRSLFYDIGQSPGSAGYNAANLQQLVDTMAAPRPTDIWLAMGINDYLQSHWNAAAFGLAYAGLVDALHQRLPGAKIYVQTLTSTGDEAIANGAGSTPPNYRTQQTNICNARPWCTLVDGTNMFPSSTCLLDAVHPFADCEPTYALNVLTALEPLNGGAGSAPTNWGALYPSGISDTGSIVNLGTDVSDAGIYGAVSVGAGVSEFIAATPLTLKGNAAATAGIANVLDNVTTQTSGSIVAFETGGVSKATVNSAGSYLSNPGLFTTGVTTTTVTLKGTAALGSIDTVMDGTVDVTGTGYITQFNAAGTAEMAITGRGHLIPLGTAPTVGSLAGGWNSTGTATGGDPSMLVSITAGVGPSVIAANATLFIVTLSQAYASQGFTTLAQFCSNPGTMAEAPIMAFANANNQVTVSTLSSFTPTASAAYKICLTTTGAGAAN